MPERCGRGDLPDQYAAVADDILDHVGDRGGIWLDVGSGPGGLGLALARRHEGFTLLLDPNRDSLRKALDAAGERALSARVAAVIGTAEEPPLLDESVDVIVSRGSFFFWRDRAEGLRRLYRLLRPAGMAVIGGGLGSKYPAWAREEFIRRQRERMTDPAEREAFREARSPITFERLAREAGLRGFEVFGEGGLDAGDPNAGRGIWLRFGKESGRDGV